MVLYIQSLAHYGLDSSGIEPWWGQDNLHPSRLVLVPTKPPIQWVPGLFPWGYSGRGMVLTFHSHLVLRLKKE